MKAFRSLTTLLSGRWQIPLALCAVILAGVTLYRLTPPPKEVPFDALLADVVTLAERGAYMDAADAVANLLEMKPPLSQPQQARLHDTLADVIYWQELARGLPNQGNVQRLLSHHHAALALGVPVTASRKLREARALLWSGQNGAAERAYRDVLASETQGELRREALQGLVGLLDGLAEKVEERREYIRQLLDDEGISDAYLWDALQTALQEALDRQDFERAREVLTRHGQSLKRSDLSGYLDYLWAWVHVTEGDTEAALPLLDRVDQWLLQHPFADAALDRAGYLPALARWLRARIALKEERPQDALNGFDEVVELQSRGNLLLRATRGRMQALAALERHSAVCDTVRETIKRLKSDPQFLARARVEFRGDVLELANARQILEKHDDALAYFELALDITPAEDEATRLQLLEQLGHEYAVAAESVSEPELRAARHAAAARALEAAAALSHYDEARLATLLWESAQHFDQGGRLGDALRLLKKFVSERSFDPRLPQALLRFGQTYAAIGDLPAAIAQYDRLNQEFPKLDEAAISRYLKAVCLIASGEECFAEAEALLHGLLEDDGIAPQAAVFHDALFELCDLLYQQKRYAEAIARMEDFQTFYPEDAALERLQFMLADAYRSSAYVLLADENAGSPEARRQTSRVRFKRAADLFYKYSAGMERKAEHSPEEEVYLQLALLNRGDCLFELNEPDALDEALSVYRMAAARYQGRPIALAAQVQVANILLRQGKLIEAARAIERARWLLGGISDDAFAEYDDSMDRAAWDRYLQALQSSDLFKEVFATAP